MGEAEVRRPVRLLGWMVILLVPVAVLGGIEAAVRGFGLEPSLDRPAGVPMWLDRNILVKETRWIELLSASPADLKNYYRTYRWDRDLFYRLQPNLDVPLTDVTAPAEIRARTGWTLHTNSEGYNTPEAAREKPAGTFRILALGDSSTFGWGVDTESAYPHVLERMLRERHPGLGIEVVNLGVCGYSSFQGLIVLKQEALPYQPDLVTLSYGSNDYSPVPEAFDVAYQRNRGWTGAVREALQHSRAYQVSAALLMSRFGRGAPHAEGSNGKVNAVLNVGPEKSRILLETMAQLSRKAGMDAIFVSNCVPGEMSAPIRAAAAATGTPLVDSEPLLEAAVPDVAAGARYAQEFSRYKDLYGPQLLADYPWLAVYLTDQCHPNVVGHRLEAEALARLVEESPSFKKFIGRAR
ncbi:MAG TPA: GDSL-type esterase/lipase family protein [Candidatus Polarisedimenticolia bacterium]|nr:GDSL-type esterase/lipase family protein [Candidatus Polarisedimenticolia bacterium]